MPGSSCSPLRVVVWKDSPHILAAPSGSRDFQATIRRRVLATLTFRRVGVWYVWNFPSFDTGMRRFGAREAILSHSSCTNSACFLRSINLAIRIILETPKTRTQSPIQTMAETTTTEEVLNPSNPIPNFFSNPENTEQQPPSTIGIFHQHTALHVNDFDRTVNFYEKVLGFRVAFKIEWETYKLAYLGYPQDPAKPDIPLDSITHEGGFLEILWYEVHLTGLPFESFVADIQSRAAQSRSPFVHSRTSASLSLI